MGRGRSRCRTVRVGRGLLGLRALPGTLAVEVAPDAEAKFADGRLILYEPDGKERYQLAAGERNKTLAAGSYTVALAGPTDWCSTPAI